MSKQRDINFYTKHIRNLTIGLTAIGALDKAVIKFRREGTEVEVIGLDEASATLVDKYAVHDKPDAVEKLMGGH